MRLSHGLTVLLLSLLRRKLVIIVLLAVLPPTLIFLSFSLSINSIEAYSERLLEHAGDTAIIIKENTNSLNHCLQIWYGLITIVSRETSLRAQVIVVNDLMRLKNLTNLSLRVTGSSYDEYTKISVSPALLRKLNITLGEFLRVCDNNECFSTYVTYSHSKKLENYLIIESSNDSIRLNKGFLCIRNAGDVSKSIIGSLINELREFSGSYVLVVFLAYVPILYLANVKLLEELSKELRILRVQGLSTFDLHLVFVLSASLITGLTVLYSVALSYLIVSAGITILRTLINPIIPTPQLRVEYVVLAVVTTSLNFLISYLAFRFGVRHVVS
ncbi:MAG: hypothetical protein ACK416_00370 [Zestosphaera sp.]